MVMTYSDNIKKKSCFFPFFACILQKKGEYARENEELLNKIYELQVESCERDTKLETTITFMDKRLQTMEELTAKMSETLNQQQLISAQVASHARELTDIKTNICIIKSDIANLKSAGTQKIMQVLSKIVWIIVPLVIASIYGYLISNGFFSRGK